jgi:hypothetical protein
MPDDDILSLAPPPGDERVPYGSDTHQFGDLRLPKGNGPHPVVMNIHDGFWRNEYDLTHAGHLWEALTAKGVATWNLEYRRVGDEGGGWPVKSQFSPISPNPQAAFRPSSSAFSVSCEWSASCTEIAERDVTYRLETDDLIMFSDLRKV